MTAGVTNPTADYSFMQILYKTVQRHALLMAMLALAMLLAPEPWRAAVHCQADVPCVTASDDVPEVTVDTVAVIEPSEYAASDSPITSSDDDVHKYTATASQLRFTAQAAADTATRLDWRWRVFFPDKTGPPRA